MQNFVGISDDEFTAFEHGGRQAAFLAHDIGRAPVMAKAGEDQRRHWLIRPRPGCIRLAIESYSCCHIGRMAYAGRQRWYRCCGRRGDRILRSPEDKACPKGMGRADQIPQIPWFTHVFCADGKITAHKRIPLVFNRSALYANCSKKTISGDEGAMSRLDKLRKTMAAATATVNDQVAQRLPLSDPKDFGGGPPWFIDRAPAGGVDGSQRCKAPSLEHWGLAFS